MGLAALMLQLGKESNIASCISTILGVEVSSGYNAIMGRLTLNAPWAIPSTYEQKVKFPTVNCIWRGVGESLAS